MEQHSVKANLKPSVAGYYKIEAVNADTGEKRVVADWFPNLITNIGLNGMGNKAVLTTCSVGSSSTTPAVTDSDIGSLVARTSTITYNGSTTSGSSPYYGSYITTWRFGIGVAAGNLSEVTTGWVETTTYYAFSRSLILDGSGNPTTITILSNEFLDITYELRLYAPTDDVVMDITLAGDTYHCTVRPASVTTTFWGPNLYNYGGPKILYGGYVSVYSGTIGAVTGGPSGTSVAADSSGSYLSALTYESNSLTRKWYVIFGLDSANFSGGIQSLYFSIVNFGQWQIGFSPAIPKDNTKTLRLDFGVTWARKT